MTRRFTGGSGAATAAAPPRVPEADAIGVVVFAWIRAPVRPGVIGGILRAGVMMER